MVGNQISDCFALMGAVFRVVDCDGQKQIPCMAPQVARSHWFETEVGRRDCDRGNKWKVRGQTRQRKVEVFYSFKAQ